MQLVFATNNEHKLAEVRKILGDRYKIWSLDSINCRKEIPEIADTLEGNSLLKSRFVKRHYGYNCFADDTGLEVTALNNAPGAYSARYAGASHDSEANRRKLLREMEGKKDRSARFRTVISLIIDEQEYLFEGIVEGEIIGEERGVTGFGYDSIFMPVGYTQTFAELGVEVKNNISHRSKAVRELRCFLDGMK